MAHKSYEELEQQLDAVTAIIAVGSLWRHYKTGDTYKIVDVMLEESTDKPGVAYVPIEHPKVKIFRQLASFLETIEINGETLPRFTSAD